MDSDAPDSTPKSKSPDASAAEGPVGLPGARMVLGVPKGAADDAPKLKPVAKTGAASGNVTPIKSAAKPAPAKAQPAPPPQPDPQPVRSNPVPSMIKRRHRVAITTFVFIVLMPLVILGCYLAGFAQDQYVSNAGFSVRKEEGASVVDSIAGITQITGSVSTDAEILYAFIKSQDMVQRMDSELDLAGIYSRDYDGDPLFSLKPGATIEDKVKFWQRVVIVKYDEATGLLDLQVRAFSPEEAQKVGQSIINYGSEMINGLSEIAREDATRYAMKELDRAVIRLKEAREALTRYRSETQTVDPTADVQVQLGLMTTLQGQLAAALIEQDLLKDYAPDSDPRFVQLERRIEVINRRIAEEKRKFGVGGEGGADSDDYATRFAQYESLLVDRQVAEEGFRSATVILDAARGEAQRKSRYLAAHVQPTLAQGALYPHSLQMMVLTAFFLTLAWALMVLIFYSIRDRR